MMQTPTANSYQLNMKLGNHMPVSTAMTTSTMMSNSSRKTSCSDAASDIIDADYVDKNIPKMELLKISYVSRSRNNLTNTTSTDDSDVVQLRAKKRIHSKQQMYQRSHSDGLLKVSELAKLSGCTENAAVEHNSNKTSAVTSATTTTTTTTANLKATPQKSQPLPMSSHHQNPLKYTVYKKHNSCDATAAMKSEKLQYTNDDAIFKAKKKYSMFDSRKRNSIDNIQFYFDSKSYERHVDNKIYGVLMPNANTAEKTSTSASNGARTSVKRLAPAAPPPNYENKSNSWNFVKATKQLLNGSHVSRMASGQKYMKNVPSAKKQQRESSLVDLTRIGQLFRETRRASADDLLDGGRMPVRSESKHRTSECNDSGNGGGCSAGRTHGDNKTASTSQKIKKLSTNFENKCLCDYRPKQLRGVSERKISAPPHLFSDANSGRTNEQVRSRRKLEYPVDSNEKKSPPSLESRKSNRMLKCNSFEYDDEKAAHFDKGFYLLDKARSKSVSIEHGIPLFGHFQSNCKSSPSSCGYKNCTFINCPMSSITAALSNVKRHHNTDKIASKSSINAEKGERNLEECKMKNGHNISITKIDTISNKSKLYLKTKDFNDDDDEFLKEFERNGGGNGVTLNNLKNVKNTTNINNSNTACTNGSTTIPIKFTPNQQNLNNSMKCKSVEKLDFNSTSTIENKKFNNVLSANEKTSFSKNEDDNRVKIFIRNPPAQSYPTNVTNTQTYETLSSNDSVSDYYDSVPNESDCDKKPSESDSEKCNIGDFGITPTTNLLKPSALKQSTINLSPTSGKNLKNLFPSRLGCDGAIFWNDCFYYDEHACCNCKTDPDKESSSNECCTCSQNRSSTNSSNNIEDDDDLEVNHNRNQIYFNIRVS